MCARAARRRRKWARKCSALPPVSKNGIISICTKLFHYGGLVPDDNTANEDELDTVRIVPLIFRISDTEYPIK